MILVTKWFGSFLCVEGEVRKSALFPNDPTAIADRLEVMRKGGTLDEERRLVQGAVQVADRRLSGLGRVTKFDSFFIKPEAYGFTLSVYREATIELAKRMAKSSIGADVYLGHAVRAHDDLVFTNNILSERLHEWYSLHFPELGEVLFSEDYVDAIINLGFRDDILSSLDERMDSIGADIDKEDLDSIRDLASALKSCMAARRAEESYIESRMRQVAPNITTLVGPVIGARLIMQAGSLKRLASMPSGTIQLLGAEKAMFRHLKKNAKPPKHGMIFQHPLVHNAPEWQRGPIARAFASKLSIAARADAYTGNDVSSLLKEQLDRRVEEIRKQRAAPLKRPSGKRKKVRRKGR
ncbi:MAG: ribosomal biogenesis protein [Thermoplasmata archaeon]|nr:ribosomal biogenesis protein [Thermoplasmata archaeon]